MRIGHRCLGAVARKSSGEMPAGRSAAADDMVRQSVYVSNVHTERRQGKRKQYDQPAGWGKRDETGRAGIAMWRPTGFEWVVSKRMYV